MPLEGVAKGINYAMIITTCNGLWRYQIGDTVEFTSLAPYKIRIAGRTRHYINAFGEEVIVDNAETALKAACDATGARISDYTAGPIYMNGRSKGSHQWVVEFDTPPDDAERFTDTLDRALQSVNSDYEAKRFKDTTLMRPTLTVVPPGHVLPLDEKPRQGGRAEQGSPPVQRPYLHRPTDRRRTFERPEMKRPTNAVLLGPAHPYRGGLADFDHLLARALNRAGMPLPAPIRSRCNTRPSCFRARASLPTRQPRKGSTSRAY